MAFRRSFRSRRSFRRRRTFRGRRNRTMMSYRLSRGGIRM